MVLCLPPCWYCPPRRGVAECALVTPGANRPSGLPGRCGAVGGGVRRPGGPVLLAGRGGRVVSAPARRPCRPAARRGPSARGREYGVAGGGPARLLGGRRGGAAARGSSPDRSGCGSGRTLIRFSLSRENIIPGHGDFGVSLTPCSPGSQQRRRRPSVNGPAWISQTAAAPGPSGLRRTAPNTHTDSGGLTSQGRAAVPRTAPRPVPIPVGSRSRGHSKDGGLSPWERRQFGRARGRGGSSDDLSFFHEPRRGGGRVDLGITHSVKPVSWDGFALIPFGPRPALAPRPIRRAKQNAGTAGVPSIRQAAGVAAQDMPSDSWSRDNGMSSQGLAPSAPVRRRLAGRPAASASHETVDVKDLLGMEHVVEGPAQLVGQRRVRFRLAHARRQPIQEFADAFVLLALRTAASEKAHFSQALPALRLPTPVRLPADSCTAPHSRAYEQNCCRVSKRSTASISSRIVSDNTAPTPGVDCSTANSVE